MVLGIGVDLIEKARFADWLSKPGVQSRFAAAELTFAEKSGRAEEALAAAFAAKEAFYKAAAHLLDDSRGIFWQAELWRDASGRPEIRLPESLRAELSARGVNDVLVSLTHDREQVCCVILLVCDNQASGARRTLTELTPPGFTPLHLGADDLVEITAELAACWLPPRLRCAYKGTFGHVLVVGGSSNYPGAPQMTALAALKAGAGLVTLAVPESIAPPVAEVISQQLAARNGYLDMGSFPVLQALFPGKIPVIGMGLSRAAETVELAAGLAVLPGAKVIDADGLYALAAAGIMPTQAVLTPHSGEMARLLGITPAEVENDRLIAVRQAAARFNAVVVLKGHRTLVSAPDGRCYVNSSGNPGMATGGSGDVLAGIIGAWLAQGMDLFRAAAFGVYLHGLAGDLAAQELTEYAMSATDIISFLPAAYKQLLVVRNSIFSAGNVAKEGNERAGNKKRLGNDRVCCAGSTSLD